MDQWSWVERGGRPCKSFSAIDGSKGTWMAIDDRRGPYPNKENAATTRQVPRMEDAVIRMAMACLIVPLRTLAAVSVAGANPVQATCYRMRSTCR